MVKITTVLLLFTVSVSSAWAANEGYFVAADIGATSYSNAPVMRPSGFCIPGCVGEFGSSTILSVSGGYHFNQNVGVEVSSTRINSSGNDWSSGSGGFFTPVTTTKINETLSGSSLRVAAVGTYPLDNSWNVIAKLGLAHSALTYTISQTINSVSSYASVTGSKTNLIYGVGVQRNYNQHFGLRFQYENLGHIQIGSAGAAYDSNVGVQVYSLGCVFNF